MGENYVCNKCGYQWMSRKGQSEPAYCPRCTSKKIEIYEGEVRNQDINIMNLTSCDYCGRKVIKIKIRGECQAILGITRHRCTKHKWIFYTQPWLSPALQAKELCDICAKECKKCGKIFCPEHIVNHKCR